MRKLLISIIITLFFACGNDDMLLKKTSIDSKIKVEPRELLGENARHLVLYCKTEKNYPCVNYPILTDQHFGENKISITFTEIAEEDICLTAIGPATTTIGLGNIDNGEYELELNNGALKNIGKLIVTDTDIGLYFTTQDGIEIVRQTTKKIPANTYWGTIGYHTEQTVENVNGFLEQLKNIEGIVFTSQDPGKYFYYEIDQKGQMVTDTENSGYHFIKAFIFQFIGDDEGKILEEIDRIATSYFDDMYINIETFRGERIYNWD